ncbi:hypothetical protein AB0N05_24290 [Nocardia sp. NPDC051030]|uniref:hypothetical protein n=1 Tax=Nocardia sp. NPDC051030 TaxID=3155162 RepID=UPI00341E8612
MTEPSEQYFGVVVGHTPLDGMTEPSEQYFGVVGHTPLFGMTEPSEQYLGVVGQTPLDGMTEPSSQYFGVVGHTPLFGITEPSEQYFGVVGQTPLDGMTEPSSQYFGVVGHTPLFGMTEPSSQYFVVVHPSVHGLFWPPVPSWVPPPSPPLYPGWEVTVAAGEFATSGGIFAGTASWRSASGTDAAPVAWVIPGWAQPIPAEIASTKPTAPIRRRRTSRFG